MSLVRHVTFEASKASQAQPQETEDIEEMSKSQRKRNKINEQCAQLAAAAPLDHEIRRAYFRAASMPAKDKTLVYCSYREYSHVLAGIRKLGYLHNRNHQLEKTLDKMDALGLLKPLEYDKSDEALSDAWLEKVMNFPPLDSTHKTACGQNRPRVRGKAPNVARTRVLRVQGGHGPSLPLGLVPTRDRTANLVFLPSGHLTVKLPQLDVSRRLLFQYLMLVQRVL